ncbi:hypothetical protein AHAS_Ahas05G0092500 [Arachis hypogaea]
MLSALVKRWRPESQTFVMPVGEVTVTLENVLHIFHLLIDRDVVTDWTDSSQNFLVTQSLAIFGSEPIVSSSSKNTQPLDTWDFIQGYVRCHIFCLLGTTLFVDNLTANAHAKYLPLLRNFELSGTYSWGSATLAHLNMSLWSHHPRTRAWMSRSVASNRHEIDYMKEVGLGFNGIINNLMALTLLCSLSGGRILASSYLSNYMHTLMFGTQ